MGRRSRFRFEGGGELRWNVPVGGCDNDMSERRCRGSRRGTEGPESSAGCISICRFMSDATPDSAVSGLARWNVSFPVLSLDICNGRPWMRQAAASLPRSSLHRRGLFVAGDPFFCCRRALQERTVPSSSIRGTVAVEEGRSMPGGERVPPVEAIPSSRAMRLQTGGSCGGNFVISGDASTKGCLLWRQSRHLGRCVYKGVPPVEAIPSSRTMRLQTGCSCGGNFVISGDSSPMERSSWGGVIIAERFGFGRCDDKVQAQSESGFSILVR